MAAVGELRVAAYRAGHHLSDNSTYAPVLRDLGADGHGEILVAVSTADNDAAGPAGRTGPVEPTEPTEPTGPAKPTGPAGPADQAGPAEPAKPADTPAADTVVGTVMLQLWPDTGDIVRGPGEAEIRALAVAPGAQGAGVGTALLKALIERARRRGVGHLVLYTQPDMRAAQHMYEREGFRRLAERDRAPRPGYQLLAYGLVLSVES
jgi:ribosomal protein S18 acetylase RimI-like enzyme